MGRIICIDFGLKRCGIAVTDPLQIIATGLAAVHPKELIPFLKNYRKENEIELILIGLPVSMNGTPTDATEPSQKMFQDIRKALPETTVKQLDERYTSKIAYREMRRMGMKKSARQKKENIDIIAATMMLQEYLESNR